MVLMRVFRDKAIRTALTITLLLFVKSETVADENANGESLIFLTLAVILRIRSLDHLN